MDYRKEKQFIVAYEDGKCRGKWNILTTEFVGIKGNVVKSTPAAFTMKNVESVVNPYTSAFIFFHTHYDQFQENVAEKLQRIEEVISVGLRFRNYDWQTWRNLHNEKTKLTKECVQYIMEHEGGIYSYHAISEYNVYFNYKELIEKCTDHKEWVTNVLFNIRTDIPADFVKSMILRGIHEKIFYGEGTHYTGYANIINNWYDMVKTLGDKLEVKHNILTNYRILQWLYNEYKIAHYDENLKKNNDLPWLYFETDDYIITPLLSRADFHKEAEAQHNCVERLYMEKVADGQTHVVSVRKKSASNDSYITCEVSNTGEVRQFLLKYNNYIHDVKDRDLLVLYTEHIRSSLKK